MQRRLAQLTLFTGILLQLHLAQPASTPTADFFSRVVPFRGRYTELVVPQKSNNDCEYGQTVAAMCINSVTGKSLRTEDIQKTYGFELLRALNAECQPAGFAWRDGGEIRPGWWEFLHKQVEQKGLPVSVALNGPEFCPGKGGVLVLVVAVKANWAKIADPVTGTFRWVKREQMEAADLHPDGNWMFYAERLSEQ